MPRYQVSFPSPQSFVANPDLVLRLWRYSWDSPTFLGNSVWNFTKQIVQTLSWLTTSSFHLLNWILKEFASRWWRSLKNRQTRDLLHHGNVAECLPELPNCTVIVYINISCTFEPFPAPFCISQPF